MKNLFSKVRNKIKKNGDSEQNKSNLPNKKLSKDQINVRTCNILQAFILSFLIFPSFKRHI